MSIYVNLLQRPKRCSICSSIVRSTASVGAYVNGKYIVHVYWCGDYACACEYARGLTDKALTGGVHARSGRYVGGPTVLLLKEALAYEAKRRAGK